MGGRSMRTVKSLALVAVLLFMAPAFAEENKEQDSKIITELQVKQAISLLIKVGVLDVDGNELVVKRPSILEELEQRGHVESGHATPSSICAKDM